MEQKDSKKDNIPRSNVKGKSFWGPPIWFAIHALSAVLRPENAEYYKQFLESLTHLLPCEECKNNLKLKLTSHPPDAYLSNNDDAFFYSYMLHDLANENISQEHPDTPKESSNYDEIKTFYFNGLSQECKSCGT